MLRCNRGELCDRSVCILHAEQYSRVPIALEELGLEYELKSVNVRQGEQKRATPGRTSPLPGGGPERSGGRRASGPEAIRAPEFGEHTEDILMNMLGLTWDP